MKKQKKNKKEESDSESEDEPLPPFNIGDYFKSQEHAELMVQGIACKVTGDIKNTNATDKAILELIPRIGQDYKKIREDHLEANFTRFQFTSKRKRMATVVSNVKNAEFGYPKRVHVKGASEMVLATCSHYIDAEGK